MNEPPKTLTQAVDDLRLIRQVLDQTATSFRTLAPEFFRMGWSGWFTASSPAWSSGRTPWPFLFPEAFSGWDPTTGLPPSCPPSSPGPGGLVGLPAGPVHPVAARRAPSPPWGEGAGDLAGLCWCSTSCCSCWRGASSTTPPLPMSSEPTSFAWDHAWALLLQPALPAHPLPQDPLVVTGILLSERPLFVLGLVVSALAVCSAFGPGLVPVLATILPCMPSWWAWGWSKCFTSRWPCWCWPGASGAGRKECEPHERTNPPTSPAPWKTSRSSAPF